MSWMDISSCQNGKSNGFVSISPSNSVDDNNDDDDDDDYSGNGHGLGPSWRIKSSFAPSESHDRQPVAAAVRVSFKLP